MPRPKMYEWELTVAFTAEQTDLIESYAAEHDVTLREATRRIFNIGAATLANGGRRVDVALAAAGR